MLKELGLAALKDFIGFLKKEPQFFSLEEKKRHEALLQVFSGTYPGDLIHYFSQVSEGDFLTQSKQALAVFDRSAYADPKNEFLNALANYLFKEFAQQFDQLTIAFFFDSLAERSTILNKLFSGKTFLHHAVCDLVLSSTYQEIGMQANADLSYLKEAPFVVIQTPMELSSEMRRNIRSHVVEKYPFSFPEFQVNPQIIGGLRVFVGGKVMDHSWMGRIQSLANLAQLSK